MSVDMRPWGEFKVLDSGHGFKAKFIKINIGSRISLQRHLHRDEHWVVLNGVAKIIIDDEKFLMRRNQHIHIPALSKHRIENVGKYDLEMIEVQLGDYLEEDDIERYEDDYGRE
jgi:mannose-6-phosphate isomerase-like protein (cupin superfamily)